MKHKAIITIEADPEDTTECNITCEMFPPLSKTQDNFAASIALAMIESVSKDA